MKGDFLLVTINNCHGIALESVKNCHGLLLESVNGVLSSPMITAMVFCCALSYPNGVFLVVVLLLLFVVVCVFCGRVCVLWVSCVCFFFWGGGYF